MANQIKWAKWVDPYGRNQEEYKNLDEIENPNLTPYEQRELEEETCEINECGGESGNRNNPILITPLGFLPLKFYNNILSYSNYWVGETDFKLTPRILRIIND